MFTGLVELIGGMFLSLLPPRYRGRFTSHEALGLWRATLVSAFLQITGGVGFLIFDLYRFVGAGGNATAQALMKQVAADKVSGVNDAAASAFIGLLSFALTPSHMIAYYLIIDGVVRIGGVLAGQTLGFLPLYLISGIQNAVKPHWREHKMGERIADEIRGAGEGFELQILSCRPKLDWHRNITVRYRGEFYQMFKEETGSVPRPFIYYLRKPPIGHLVVVIREYSPDDVLKKTATTAVLRY